MTCAWFVLLKHYRVRRPSNWNVDTFFTIIAAVRYLKSDGLAHELALVFRCAQFVKVISRITCWMICWTQSINWKRMLNGRLLCGEWFVWILLWEIYKHFLKLTQTAWNTKESFNRLIRKIWPLTLWIDMRIMFALNVVKLIMAGKLDVMLKWATNTIQWSWCAAAAAMWLEQRWFIMRQIILCLHHIWCKNNKIFSLLP